ncbi:porin family protein [Sulfurovum sp. bin170]|uniref:outer membrane beta-barrel protein n=1 Tax=Sulfurovum sp. bin170 TaxID=2695268 RepID=UPI0013DED461|nr:outer membrane beta-barrel protein [Sulfurovum sp. bin170]NEW59804.1 porin family protein [Sulfurovum sp. bin170]
MVKKILLISIFLSNLSFAKVYTDLKYTLLNYSKNGTDKDFKTNGYKLTLGYMFEEFSYIDIGVENSIAFATGEKRDSVEFKNGTTLENASVDIDFLYAVHLKATAPIIDILYGNLYLGWDSAKVGTSATNYTNSSKWENSFSYGVGFEYWIPLGVSLQLNYMSYFNNLNAIEFGFGLKY